jgi:HSP20 family molecular chaperone IbpA
MNAGVAANPLLSLQGDGTEWDPFREIAPMTSMDRLNEIDAPFEVKETKEGYLFKADVPGIKESDLTINLSGNRLTVSGKREEEKKQEAETYFSYEPSSSTCSVTSPATGRVSVDAMAIVCGIDSSDVSESALHGAGAPALHAIHVLDAQVLAHLTVDDRQVRRCSSLRSFNQASWLVVASRGHGGSPLYRLGGTPEGVAAESRCRYW